MVFLGRKGAAASEGFAADATELATLRLSIEDSSSFDCVMGATYFPCWDADPKNFLSSTARNGHFEAIFRYLNGQIQL